MGGGIKPAFPQVSHADKHQGRWRIRNGPLRLGLLFHSLLSRAVAKVIYSLESCDHPTRSTKSSWWGSQFITGSKCSWIVMDKRAIAQDFNPDENTSEAKLFILKKKKKSSLLNIFRAHVFILCFLISLNWIHGWLSYLQYCTPCLPFITHLASTAIPVGLFWCLKRVCSLVDLD